MRWLALKITIVLMLAAMGALAWLTRHPEAEVLARATEWPYVGGLAAKFRAAYLPAPAPAVEDQTPEIIYVDPRGRPLEGGVRGGADPDRTLGARPVVWVNEGTALLAEPTAFGPEIGRTGGIANLRILERRGDWFQVLYQGEAGWVFLEGYQESDEPPLGSDPLPPGPLAAQPPDEDRLALVRELMPDAASIRIGPYDAWARRIDPDLLAFLDELVGSIERVYVERYGVTPVGEPGGALVLFDRHDDFAAYQERELPLHGINAAGVTGGGVAAIDLDGRALQETAATTIHEVVHLLNRRALGPALPPWLEEGLADDLAHSEVAADGRLDTRRLGGLSLQRPDGWEWRGALASAVGLRRALDAGRLRPLAKLVALDWSEFVESGDSQDSYAEASFWIRHLLAQPSTVGELRGFLAGVAAGRSAEGEELRRRLGAEWSLLDERYHRWIRIRFHDPTQP